MTHLVSDQARPRRRLARTSLSCLIVAIFTAGTTVVGTAQGAATTKLTDPVGWEPWFLSSAEQFRLTPPPATDSRRTKREVRELLELKSERTASVRRQVRKWNRGPAVLPWTKLELQLIRDNASRPPFAARSLRYLHTAMYDTLIAIRDSWLVHRDVARPKPVRLDPRIDPLIGGRRGISFAPLQPALAGTAEVVLTYLFPQSAPLIAKTAEQAASSRLYAGANYRSDVEAARELGRSIGALVVENAKADGIESKTPPWPRPQPGEERAIPSGGDPDNQWQPTAPNYELPFGGPVGNWTPQIMSNNKHWLEEAVIPPPSTVGSQAFLEQTIKVLRTSQTLTDEQIGQAHFWDDPPSATATPPGHWFEIAIDQLQQYPMGTNELTRAFALLGATQGDAAIAAFGAKYYWWSIRPIAVIWRLCENDSIIYTEAQAASAADDVCPYYDNSTLPVSHPNHVETDDGWYPIIDTPAFPAYPGGHGTFSGSSSRLLGYLFPEAGSSMEQFGQLASDSRLFGGIHFDEDNDAGLTLGRWVAELAIQKATTDGSTAPSP